MLPDIPHRGPPEDRVAAFWLWFVTNEESLFLLDATNEEALNGLSAQLATIDSRLTFELGPGTGGGREFVISAGGIKELFPLVDQIAGGAPPLPRWHVVRFRQRRPAVQMVSSQGITLSPSSVRFEMSDEGEKTGIRLYMPGYTPADHSRYLTIAFAMLDAALGEFDVEMNVGSMEIWPLGDGRGEKAETLDLLPAAFDMFRQSRKN